MSKPVRWDMKRFNKDLERTRDATHRTSKNVVVHNARRLVKMAAYKCPIDTGRARAGFWPAAIALQMTNIFTPFPNQGEGQGIDNTNDKNSLSFTIVNSVPYIRYMGGKFGASTGRYRNIDGKGYIQKTDSKRKTKFHGLTWWNNAEQAVKRQMFRDVQRSVGAAIMTGKVQHMVGF